MSFFIFAKTLLGKTFSVSVTGDDTIEDIKMKIFDKEGIPLEAQFLVYAGKQLENYVTVEDAGIGKEAIIHLIVKMNPVVVQEEMSDEDEVVTNGEECDDYDYDDDGYDGYDYGKKYKEVEVNYQPTVFEVETLTFRKKFMKYFVLPYLRKVFGPLKHLFNRIMNVIRDIFGRVGEEIGSRYLVLKEILLVEFFRRVIDPTRDMINSLIIFFRNYFINPAYDVCLRLIEYFGSHLDAMSAKLQTMKATIRSTVGPHLSYLYEKSITVHNLTMEFMRDSFSEGLTLIQNVGTNAFRIIRFIDGKIHVLFTEFTNGISRIYRTVVMPIRFMKDIVFRGVSTLHRIAHDKICLFLDVLDYIVDSIVVPRLNSFWVSTTNITTQIRSSITEIYGKCSRGGAIVSDSCIRFYHNGVEIVLPISNFVKEYTLLAHNKTLGGLRYSGNAVLRSYNFLNEKRVSLYNLARPSLVYVYDTGRSSASSINAKSIYAARFVGRNTKSVLFYAGNKVSDFVLTPSAQSIRWAGRKVRPVISSVHSNIISPALQKAFYPMRLIKTKLANVFRRKGFSNDNYWVNIIPAELRTNNMSNYAILNDNTQYSISLYNGTGGPCQCKIFIDDELMGIWRLNALSEYIIERPTHSTSMFTFRLDNANGVDGDGEGTPLTGSVVKVIFCPQRVYLQSTVQVQERKKKMSFSVSSSPKISEMFDLADDYEYDEMDDEIDESEFVSGKTVLEGYSDQFMTYAQAIDVDESNAIDIWVKLVGRR